MPPLRAPPAELLLGAGGLAAPASKETRMEQRSQELQLGPKAVERRRYEPRQRLELVPALEHRCATGGHGRTPPGELAEPVLGDEHRSEGAVGVGVEPGGDEHELRL